MPTYGPERFLELKRHAQSLPHIEQASTLSHNEALAFLTAIDTTDSKLASAIMDLAHTVMRFVNTEVEYTQTSDGYLVLSKEQLHGLICRAAIGGGAIAADTIGAKLQEMYEFEALFTPKEGTDC